MCEFGRQEQGTDSSGVCGLVALAAQQALEVRIIPLRLSLTELFAYWLLGNFACFFFFCCLLIFSKSFFFLKILSGIPSEGQAVLDPDQTQHFVGPDLDPNC